MRSTVWPALLIVACAVPAVDATDAASDVSDTADSGVPGDSGDDTGEGPTVQPTTLTRTFGADTVTVTVDDVAADPRTYTLTTTHDLRDGVPADKRRVVVERGDAMVLRSGDLLLDALFAMALDELRELSVTSISDGAFSNGSGVPCDCFETGANWHYVWTRDTAYAAALGLPVVDPARTVRSLRFKLSRPKDGGPLQIVQDTGSGGSWPVSTDRVVWALGARATLPWLAGADRTAFRDDALEAMATTIARDRATVYDPRDGLYRGEQSFLDWREQTYPTWTADEVVHLATSKAFSTNVGHLILLRTAVALGDEVDHPDVATWTAWAEALEGDLEQFWDADAGLYATATGPELDPGLMPRFDALGNALAVLEGLGPDGRASAVLATLPFGPHGPPVYWPQQPDVAIYHNRAIWPFVTAFVGLAAARADAAGPFDAVVDSLEAGAALNLSHMENFEWLTLRNRVEDGDLTGPVVNSRRQLWSVAGFVGAVVHGLVGVDVDAEGLTLRPTVTGAQRRGRFADVDAIVLRRLSWRGRTVDVEVDLGAADAGGGDGVLARPAAIEVDGQRFTGRLGAEDLSGVATLRASLGAAGPATAANVVPVARRADHTAPREPGPGDVAPDRGGLKVTWTASPDAAVTYVVRRDGHVVATGLTDTSFTDGLPNPEDAPCYTVMAQWATDGHRSQPTPPRCWWGEGGGFVQTVPAHAFAHRSSATWSTNHGRPHLQDWGAPADVLEVAGLRPRRTGTHLIQPVFGNGAGPVSTGITAGSKVVRVTDLADGSVVAEGLVAMPHLGGWDRWGDGGFVSAPLDADRVYRIELLDGGNMSALEHFRPYTGGNGGGGDPYGFVNVAELKLLPRGTQDGGRAEGDLVALDGVGDLAAYPPGHVLTGGDVGVRQADEEAFGLHADPDFLYVSQAATAFDDVYAPWMVYLEAGTAPLDDAVPGTGIPYDRGQGDLTPSLPFTPTHALAIRRSAVDGAPDDGPWVGVWRREGGGDWTQVRRFRVDEDLWVSSDGRTLSVRVPRAVLGIHDTVRLTSHVVHGAPGGEWKDTVPAGHTPWSGGGTAYVLDLDDLGTSASWTEE